MSVAGGSAIAPTSGKSIVDIVDAPVVNVVVVEEDVDVSFNDEEASPEVLELEKEDEDEDEDSGQQQPSEQDVLERVVAERKCEWLEERNGGSRYR